MRKVSKVALTAEQPLFRAVACTFRNDVGPRQPRGIAKPAKVFHKPAVILHSVQQQRGLGKNAVVIAYSARAYKGAAYVIRLVLLIACKASFIPLRGEVRRVIARIIGIGGQRGIVIKAAVFKVPALSL